MIAVMALKSLLGLSLVALTLQTDRQQHKKADGKKKPVNPSHWAVALMAIPPDIIIKNKKLLS